MEDNCLASLPEIPFRQILEYLSFEDLKCLRLASRRLMKLVTNLMKNRFSTYHLYVEEDDRLPDDELFEQIDLVLNLRKRCPMTLSSRVNISVSQILAWLEKYTDQLIGLKGVKPSTLEAISTSDIKFEKIEILEVECGRLYKDQIVEHLPSFLESTSSTLVSLSLLRVNLAHFAQCPHVLPRLKHLEVYASRDARMESWLLHLISYSATTLETLSLIAFEDFSSVFELHVDLPVLTALRVHGYEDWSAAPGISYLIEHSPIISSLDLKSIDLEDLASLGVAVPSMRKIKLDFCIGNSGVLRLLECCENLQQLEIENQHQLDLSDLKHWDAVHFQLPRLTSLLVAGELMSLTSYVIIPGLELLLKNCCKNLRSLILTSVDLSNMEDCEFDLSSLTKLSTNCSSPGALANLLNRCSSTLRRLLIVYTKFCRLPSLYMIKPLTSLIYLHIQGTGRDHWSSSHSLNTLLASCSNSLETLELIGVSLTESEIDELDFDLPVIRRLVVYPALEHPAQVEMLMNKFPLYKQNSSLPSQF